MLKKVVYILLASFLSSNILFAQEKGLPALLSYLLLNEENKSSDFDQTVIPIPEAGVYNGVYTTEDIPGGASQYTVAGRLYGISEFEKMVYQTGNQNTRHVAFDRQFYRWDTIIKNGDVHPYLYATSALGRIPIASVHTLFADDSIPACPDGSAKLPWACIAAGHRDTDIVEMAEKIRDSGIPKLGLTFVHEPEDEIRCDDAKNDKCMGTAIDYVNAWRHFVQIFNAQSVSNVDFFWIVRDNIFSNSVPAGFPLADQVYPGDDVIDWIGADVYNYSFKSGGVYQWRSLAQIAHDFYQWGALHPKPLFFGEWGTREEYFNLMNDGTRKQEWFDEARIWLKNTAVNVKAVMYFNRAPSSEFANPDEFGNTGPNWKVDTTANSLLGYQGLAQDVYFLDADD